MIEFNRAIVAATADLAAAYKPNAAFYEALGEDGFHALEETPATIRERAPEAATILDAKRADIGSTRTAATSPRPSTGSAPTRSPSIPTSGGEALAPFLERAEKLVFVLARTSNPGAGELQDIEDRRQRPSTAVSPAPSPATGTRPATAASSSATYPEEMRAVRADVPASMPILIPGAGAQGGDVAATVAANREAGSNAFLINSSRSILYASAGEDFADAARASAQALDAEIRAAA